MQNGTKSLISLTRYGSSHSNKPTYPNAAHKYELKIFANTVSFTQKVKFLNIANVAVWSSNFALSCLRGNLPYVITEEGLH